MEMCIVVGVLAIGAIVLVVLLSGRDNDDNSDNELTKSRQWDRYVGENSFLTEEMERITQDNTER